MKTRRAVVLALFAWTLTACADGGRQVGNPPGERAARAVPAMVRVTNHNWAMITVYARTDGQSVRLGELESGGTRVFTLPRGAHAANDLALVVQLVGSNETYVTGHIQVAPEQIIRLTVENSLALSSYVVEGT